MTPLTAHQVELIHGVFQAGLRLLRSSTKNDRKIVKEIMETGLEYRLYSILSTSQSDFGSWLSSVYADKEVFVSQDLMSAHADHFIKIAEKCHYQFTVDNTLPSMHFKVSHVIKNYEAIKASMEIEMILAPNKIDHSQTYKINDLSAVVQKNSERKSPVLPFNFIVPEV
jgi:hypothetical protein